MKKFYPGRANHAFAYYSRAIILAVALMTAALVTASAQGLVFQNPVLVSGTAKQNGAVYRFPLVTTGIDALVKINGRSSSLVELVSIDLPDMGFGKSFQPQVTYNDGTTPSGTSDWWMEFGITFVTKNTSSPVNLANFDITALDIDGNDDDLNEWVSFYNLTSHTFESNTQLSYNTVMELLNNVLTLVGKKFNGPRANYLDIDTAATRVMTTIKYNNKNALRIRTGGHSISRTGASDRMYSFWFKSFNYGNPVESGLPVTLKSFNARLENKKPVLNWVSAVEKDVSHYAVQRSTDGIEYSDVTIVFANGTTNFETKYAVTDNAIASSLKGTVYYRLKMVDIDGKYKYSETRLIRLGEWGKTASILMYPNPAQNEIRVTVPSEWQSKKVDYQISNVQGQVVKQFSRANANQTEVLHIDQLPEGTYMLKVTAEKESAIQLFIRKK